MAKQRDAEVAHGRLGRIDYDAGERKWIFQKRQEQPRIFKAIGKPTIIQDERSHILEDSRPLKERPGKRREKQIQALTRSIPELQAAADLLPELCETSELVEQSAANFDAHKGRLLAIGRIPNEANRSPSTVVAFPAGPSGSDICLMEIQKHRRGWHDSKGVYLEVPVPSGETAFWKGPGVPIQQITFAQPFERGEGFLAVRLMTSVALFKPTLHVYSESPIPRLDVNWLLDISIEDTGGTLHVDLNFNPWYTCQLAIIDQVGRWSVWELQGRQRRNVRKVYSDQAASLRGTDGLANRSDGWARVSWIANPSTIVLSTRHAIDIVDLSVNPDERDLQINDGLLWILDIRLISDQPECFAVLTSTHVNIFHLDANSSARTSVKKILSIRHYLDPMEFSLGLLYINNGTSPRLLVHSGRSGMLVAYAISFTAPDRVTVGDPMEFECGSNYSFDSRTLHVDRASLVGEIGSPSCLANEYASKGVEFYIITALDEELRLSQCLHGAVDPTAVDCNIAETSWERKRKSVKSTRSLHHESFIVDDDLDDTDDDLSRQRPISKFVRRRIEQRADVSQGVKPVSIELTALKLIRQEPDAHTDFEEIVEEGRRILQDQRNTEALLPLKTLRDLSSDAITLRDVDLANSQLQGLQRIDPQPSSDVDLLDEHPAEAASSARLVLRKIEGFGTGIGPSSTDLTAEYNQNIERWLTPIGPGMTEYAQSIKEQVIKDLTAEMGLASRVFREETLPIAQEPSSQQELEPQWELPIRPLDRRQPSSQTPDFSSQLSSKTPPTPSTAAALSVITESSQPSTLTRPDFSHLTSLTTFSKPLPATTPRFIRKTLKHWPPHTDPSTYNPIRHHSRHQSQASNSDDSDPDNQLSQQDRLVAHRRAERHLRRQRREAALAAQQRIARSQLPSIASGNIRSSPDLRTARESPRGLRPWDADGTLPRSSPQRGPAGPSGGNGSLLGSGGFSSQVPASQVLPGRFGGRGPVRKKRKSGF